MKFFAEFNLGEAGVAFDPEQITAIQEVGPYHSQIKLVGGISYKVAMLPSEVIRSLYAQEVKHRSLLHKVDHEAYAMFSDALPKEDIVEDGPQAPVPTGGDAKQVPMTQEVLLHLLLQGGGLHEAKPTVMFGEGCYVKTIGIGPDHSADIYVNREALGALQQMMIEAGVVEPDRPRTPVQTGGGGKGNPTTY